MKSKLLLRVVAFAFIAATLSACSDDDDYYYSPLIGSWELVQDSYGPVDYNQSIFEFYDDGSGTYTDYDYGDEYTYNIYWETDDDLLYVSFGDGQQWVYSWSVSGVYLYLQDLDTGDRLTFRLY